MQVFILNQQSSSTFPIINQMHCISNIIKINQCVLYSQSMLLLHSQFEICIQVQLITYESRRVSFWLVVVVIYEDPIIKINAYDQTLFKIGITSRSTGPDGLRSYLFQGAAPRFHVNALMSTCGTCTSKE